ncbi:MAG: glycoside hydrolase family 2 protein [Chryseobacterium sp.]|jgi:beta-mannosidase|uniref:beta-mannosidase n=1 Tax=Chryseobacterium sp. TaxID=1871047 RepID=UPI0028208FB7|nr:glycoside hydrolase family 2 protein [Chryseobacterium sp.]MDR2238399.1 glycoside hydrolase family 2 protein [Chryseobacterium sp.]
MNKTTFFLFILLFIQHTVSGQFSERNLSSEKWQFRNVKDKNWLTAKVPGTVHLDLLDNKVIPDPFKDENEKKVQWIENEDWEYHTRFRISQKELGNQHIDLVFNGLDTFSEIYLNGRLLKKTDNMFRKWEIPVKEFLKEGDNELRIQFNSAVREGKKLAEKVPFTLPESPRSFVRKAQYQFGWDWGPRLVTAGIWKDVKLEFWNRAKVNAIQVQQHRVTESLAEISFNMEIFAEEEGAYYVGFNINRGTYRFNLKKGLNTIAVPYTIKNPKLWQPNGWGKPNIMSTKITLYTSKGSWAVKDIDVRYGLRTVELVQEKDEKGKSFYFKVNGKPLYAKGTNWIPGDSFSPRMTTEKYHRLIKDAKEANMNMIRIWGGGIYEDDEFYKACDENGILVWQDFMFAGSFYPADDHFLNNVKEEVKDQVRRLQNYPSVALWCGNNEIDEAIVNWGYQKQFKYSKNDSLQVWKDYRKLFHEVIPNTLKENLTPDKNIYWPSSPSVGWGHKESLTEGDSHYWGVWWGEQPFEIYNDKVGRFMSEYGFQGMPSLETVKTMFSGTPDLNLKNPVVKAHEKHSRGWEIISTYMKRDYKVSEDFVKYNYISQLLQARGMKIAVEAHRRAKPYNMGTLYWQLNDCWPVVSWSSIDYWGNWKALHYQMKRSFEQQVILAEEKEGILNFYAVNDGWEKSGKVDVEIHVMNFDGKTLKRINAVSDEKTLESIIRFDPVEMKNLISEADKNKTLLLLTLKSENGTVLAQNIHFFSKPNEMKLTKPNLQIKQISPTEIEISTDVLAKDVYLIGDTHFSDNFFDMLPHTSKKITLSKPLNTVEVMSLWDAMRD